MISRRVVCKKFVGRLPELDHLAARRRAAADMKGGLILVGGEAGIGKSRTIAEFVKTTRARVAIAECREFGQSPFGPLDEILNELDDTGTWPRTFGSPDERMAEMLATFARLAARRATIVIIEDLHWADPELLSALRVLAARAATQRLLIVASYRDDEIGPRHPNFVALGRLVREPATSVVTLERMDPPQLADLVRSALEGGESLPPLVVDDVVRRSDGNPLFAEELSRHALDRVDPAGRDRESVPLTLHAIVSERLLACTERERRLLFAAALCGRRFDLDILDDVFAERETPEERSASLRRLCDMQLIDPIEGQPRSFAFRHALTRDALYTEVLPSDAGPLHRKIATALGARTDADKRAIEIAYHYWQSGERELAAEPCEAAGRAARTALAYGDAILWYERAIEAYGNAEERVARATLELGKIFALAEEKSRAFDAYARVERYALQHGDMELLVRPRKLMAGMLVNDGRMDDALRLLEETLALLAAPEHERLRTELYLRVALHLIQQQDPERLRRALEHVDVARLEPGSVSVAEYHHASAYLAACARDVAAWSAHYERARDVYVAMRAFPFVRYSYADQAWQAISLGLLPLAQSLVTRAAAASSESASTVNDVPLTLAYASFCAGRFHDARGALESAIPSQLLSCRWVVALVRAELALANGDDEALRDTLDPELIAELARQETFGFIRLSATFAAGYVRLGRRAEARALLDGAAAQIRSTLDLVPAMLTIAELAPDLVRPLRGLLAASVGEDTYAAAALDLMDAEFARCDGRAADAERLGGAACAAFERLGWPIAAARAAIVAGRPGDALAIYRRIDHVAGVRRLAEFANAAPTDAGGDRVDVLTARERELAQLIAAGKSNRDAAGIMAVSEKTIEKYLTSTYAKLSVTSRMQLAQLVLSGRGGGPPDPAP
jgi:DNA-binding NarL/FixJ family response regulator